MPSFTRFYSDPHFGHTNIIRYANRPFNSIEEMNGRLIANYNKMIGPQDICLWLGDCFLMPYGLAEEIMHRLNGRKVLILGNHDRSAARMASLGFEEVFKKDLGLEIEGRAVRACHCPYREVEEPLHSKRYPISQSPDEIMIHGHTLTSLKITSRTTISVGVDAWDYHPVAREQLEALL